MGEDNNNFVQQNLSRNEINRDDLFLAGVAFIIFTFLPIFFLIAYWPDKLPEKEQDAYYSFHLFRVHLAVSDTTAAAAAASVVDSTEVSGTEKDITVPLTKDDSLGLDSTQKSNSTRLAQTDSVKKARADSIAVQRKKEAAQRAAAAGVAAKDIHLNTLLMLLVALAGWLGTMIHITNSFANFVGSEKFKRSWTLWYCVKPLLGSALALVFYFVFRAGLLNFNDPSNINLFGLITLASLTGLFADKAALKLEEVFTVVFKPKDERPGKLDTKYKFTSIDPQTVEWGKENTWVVSGEHLGKATFKVLVNDSDVPFTQTDAAITIRYTPTAADQALEEFSIVVLDAENETAYSTTLKTPAAATADAANADDSALG